MMYAMKYPKKKETRQIQGKESKEKNVVQRGNRALLNISVPFSSDGQSNCVCQFARGEKQADGSWKTYSSFKSKMEIDEDNWVVTCYRTRSIPAHRMLALEGHNGSMGWECSEHLQTDDMANGTQLGNILKMAGNGLGICGMRCRPEWRTDLRDKAGNNVEMPHEHVSMRISKNDGQILNDKMKDEHGKEYDYDVCGGDKQNSFNCKTWVQYMHPQFGNNI